MASAVNWKLYLSTAFLLAFFTADDILAMAIDGNSQSLAPWPMQKETSQDSPKLSSVLQTQEAESSIKASSHKASSQVVVESLPFHDNHIKANKSASIFGSKKVPTRGKSVPSTTSDRLLIVQRYLLIILYFIIALCVFVCLLWICYIISICNEPVFDELHTSTSVANRDETLLASIHYSQPASKAHYLPEATKRNTTGKSQARALEGLLNQAVIPFTLLDTKAGGTSSKDSHYMLISGSNKSPTNYPVSPTEPESLQVVGENEFDLHVTPPASLPITKPKLKQHPRRFMVTATVNIRVEPENGDENQEEDEAPPSKRICHSKTFSLSK